MIVLNDTLQRLDAALLLIDAEHRIQWMNNKAREWFGISKTGERRVCYRTMALSQGFCSICPTGRTIEFRTPTHYEFTIPGKRPRKLEVIAVPIDNSKGGPTSVMEVVMDVTERGVVKVTERELMTQIERMAAIGQLAAGVAHELNTPLGTLSIISNELSRILEGFSKEKATRKVIEEYLADMQGEISRCKTIIQDLLGFSKSGVSQLVETDINTLVSKTIDFIDKGKKGCDITVTKSFDPTLPMIITDHDRFRQVVFNVLKNAIESVEENGGGRVDVSTKGEGCFISVSIKDNGPGISKENIRRVFEPFFTTKPVGKGTGLGLSVSYGIMGDLGGEIRLDSIEGKGTTVTLYLPIATSHPPH